MSLFTSTPQAPDLDKVKNCVVWKLERGEVARRINVAEFENLSGARGVYVQEGVVAVLMIDGRIVTKLSSGVYYFPTMIERIGEAFKHIWRFFAGKKEGGSFNEEQTRQGRLGSELQNLGKSSLVDVILVIEGYIPVVLGIQQDQFAPYEVYTQKATLKVGVSMNLSVTDFPLFRKNYLTQSRSCRIYDLQAVLNDPVKNTLQEQLAYVDVEAAVLPPELKDRIRHAIVEKTDYVLHGVSVAQVIDISINSQDFERFHELEHKLYCTSRELEYLIRTNDFKNRLTAENNNQTLKEARSEEDLRYSLNLLNKDKLLHDDEMEAFCQLLASQKRIRESQTDADTEKALREIEGNDLVSEDELEALKHELKKKKDVRAEIETLLMYQSTRRTETERLNVQQEIDVLTVRNEKELEQAQFETAKQELEHRDEIESIHTAHNVRMNDTARGETKKNDDYADSRREKEHEMDVKEAKDDIALENEEAMQVLNRVRVLKQIKLEEKERDAAIARADKEQEHIHKVELEKLELERKRIEAENEQALQRITADMDADQLAAMKINLLSEEAQKALAEAISSKKENEWLKITTEERVHIIQELAQQSANIDKENRERQERTMKEMMDFMTHAMETNASVVTGAVNGQQATTKAQMETMKDIATHRIGEVYSDKEEAWQEAHHSQARLDHTQDAALHYTTQATGAKMHAEGMKAMAGAGGYTVYIIEEFGAKPFDFNAVLGMIKEELVTPDTEIIIGEEKVKAYDLKEFQKIFDKLYSVECPKCGRKGLKGHLCKECGTQL